jgi:hypothetical protein
MIKSPVVKSITEPKQRKDGRCVLAECRKIIPLVGLRMGDPFCSAVCCRKHYDVEANS